MMMMLWVVLSLSLGCTSWGFVTVSHRRVAHGFNMSMKSSLASRKVLLFDIFESGLRDHHSGARRVFEFCEFAKNEK